MGDKRKPGNKSVDPQRIHGCDPNKVVASKKEYWRKEARAFLCDLVPQVPIPGTFDFGELRMPILKAADAQKMMQPIADAIGVDKVELARRFANAWVIRRNVLGEKLWGDTHDDEDDPSPRRPPRRDMQNCKCGGRPITRLEKGRGYYVKCEECGVSTKGNRRRGDALNIWEINFARFRRAATHELEAPA